MPFVSIITVNYNNSNGLDTTIKSVLAQTFKDYEFIIIDGGSTDGSVEIINKYAAKITYWISEPDKGIYNAMNKGVKRAAGSFIYFLNSGDKICEKTLERIFAIGESVFNYDVIYGDIKHLDSLKIIKSNQPETIIYDLPFCHQAVISKTKLHNTYPFNENYKIAADYIFFLNLYFKKYHFLKVDKVFGEIDTTGVSNTAYFKAMAEYFKALMESSNGISRIYNPLNYLWRKKAFIIYILLNKLLGPVTYRKAKSIFK